MRTQGLCFAITLLWFSPHLWATTNVSEALSDYAWQKRQLVVFSPSLDHPELVLFNQVVSEFKVAFDERRLQTWRVLPDQVVTLNKQVNLDLNSQQFQRHFSVNPDDFRLFLVGYDQGIKLQQHRVDIDDIFAEIDQMPIRQQEMVDQMSSPTAKDAMPKEMIDDRHFSTLQSRLGGTWTLVSDQVMGGVSTGEAIVTTRGNRPCVQMKGVVSTDNNGGFLQIALDLNEGKAYDASQYTGIKMNVWGNQENYGLHLRTKGLWFPWQAYRSSFSTSPEWQIVTLPFSAFQAYKTSKAFNPAMLKRIGLVAIGRDFEADVCLGKVWFY